MLIKRVLTAGSTSAILLVPVLDSASTTGGRKTGITYNDAAWKAYYKRSNGTAVVACTINTIATLGTYAGAATAFAWKELDATNMKGAYELHLPNDALAAGADNVILTLVGPTGMEQLDVLIELEVAKANEAYAETVLVHAHAATIVGFGAPPSASTIANAVRDLATSGLTALKTILDGIAAKTTNLPTVPASKADADAPKTLTADYEAVKTALQEGGSVVASNMRGTDGALLATDYVDPPAIPSDPVLPAGAITDIIDAVEAVTVTVPTPTFTGTVNQPAQDLTPVVEAIAAIPAPTFTGTVSAPDVHPTVLDPTERALIAAAVVAADAPPVGYVRVTSATYGTLLPGTVIDAYAVADTDHASPVTDPVTVAANGSSHIDLPTGATYTLVGRLNGKATVTTEVTT